MTDSVSTTMAKGSRSSMKGLWMIQPTRTTSGSTKIAICGGGNPQSPEAQCCVCRPSQGLENDLAHEDHERQRN